MTELLTAIAQAVAVISACVAIISGVGAWKREFVGKRKIELAEEALSKFFAVKDAVAFVRSPFRYADEGKSRKHEPSESNADSELLDRGYVIIERYQKREALFIEFSVIKYRFMASFGPDTEQIFTDTASAVNSIFVSAEMLATHYWKHRPPTDVQQFLDEKRRHEGVFWDSGADDDVIRKQLQAVQVKLEVVTAPCFKEPMSFFTRWAAKFTPGQRA